MPPRTTVSQWDIDNRDNFSDRYARARNHLLEIWADDVVEISDNGSNDWMERNDPENPGFQLNGEHVQRSKLRTDNRKWLLAHLRPGQYGDRITQEHIGDPAKPIVVHRLEIVPVKPVWRDE